MPGADPDLVQAARDAAEEALRRPIMLKTKVARSRRRRTALHVTFEGDEAPPAPQTYDRVLVAVGRAPNGGKIGAEKAGVAVNERGFIPVDRQMRTNVPHIFAIGDIVGEPMLAHKATHEGKLAAEVAGRAEARLRCARDPGGRLHRSGNRLGRRSPRPRRRRRACKSRRRCSRGPRAAARSASAATKASPSCCSTRRRSASSAPASSA